ncbi:MAG: phage tail tape measure protein, partial [Selenomonadaceae bacterium]|nr:phage tail tape measure protein [Selenomonadaceae bacterium]
QKTGAELKSLASGIKQAERELANIGTSFDQSKKKAAQLKQELKSQQPTLNEMRKSLASQGFNTKDFINSNRKLREQMATATRDLRTQQLRETLSAAGMKLSGGNVNVNVSGNATSKLGSIKKELQSITQKTWNVAVNAKNAIGGKVNEFANGAMLGMGAQMLGTAGVGYGLIDSVQTYRNFEKQIARNVALATPGMSGAETTAVNERFSAAARYYGATTPLTAEQIGKAQEYAIIAGWDADKILGQSFKNGDVNPVMGAEGALKPIIQASIASGEDLAMVSDIITDSMTAMGYKAGQIIPTTNGQLESTQHFVDVLMKTTVSANTNFQQLGLAMKYTAPLAHTAGYNIEDMAVALGLMANNGIKVLLRRLKIQKLSNKTHLDKR